VELFGVQSWALWCAIGLMVLAAAINARTLMVPNRLSLSAALVGLLAALLVSGFDNVPSRGGGILASLAGAGVGFGLLLPFYLAGGLGAGCVKMQAAFGAWVGCALPVSQAALLVGLGTVAGGLLTAAAVLVKTWRAEREGSDTPRSRVLPAQLTLSFGSIGAVVMPLVMGWA
jgi:prepilin peptidase CpaA